MICPICTYRGEPGPVTASGARESLLCPWCGCSSRHRGIAKVILDEAWWGEQATHILQVGCDPLTPFLGVLAGGHGGTLTVTEMEERPGCVKADLEHLHFAGGAFDLVICSDVLEHVRLYKLALANLARVLAVGGTLILTVPGAPTPDEHYEFGHVRDPLRPDLDQWEPDTPRHEDPLEPRGCPVYRTYGRAKLAAELNRLDIRASWRDEFDPEYAIVTSPVLVGVKMR